MKNITVSVPDDVYARARVHAAKAGTSVSAMVRDFLTSAAVDEDDEFDRLRALQQEIQAQVGVFAASDRASRDEIHDRALR